MGKVFREWVPEQATMLPCSVMDYVPAGHYAHFVRDLVLEQLDLQAILAEYQELRGMPPYHPVMMTALILYSYSEGVYASRRIAKACEQRLDFWAVTGGQKPDFRTISDFRKRHLKGLGNLFAQVLRLCREAGLIHLGHVALDGTRIAGNASKSETMSYARMKQREQELGEEIAGWFKRAEQEDAEEDGEFGPDRRGDELPEWVTDKQKRLEKLGEIKAKIEAEAKAESDRRREEDEQKPPRQRARKPIPETPLEDEKRNLTDSDSRLLRTMNGYVQGYNAQIAVDADTQVIVGSALSNSRTDLKHLVPLIEQVEANTDDVVREISADSGYYSEANLEQLSARAIRGYVAVGGRGKQGQWRGHVGVLGRAMRARIRRAGKRSRYRLRGQTVEPVFGIIKSARGFRQFLLRGIEKVEAEWSLLCTAHNLLKLARGRA